MKCNRMAGVLCLLTVMTAASLPALADDNIIFGGSAALVEANILIIFDTSGSMNSRVHGRETRLDVAQQTIKGIIDDHGADNRFGIMVFHENSDYNRDGVDETNGGYFSAFEGLYPVCSVKEVFIRDNQGKLKTGEEHQTALAAYKDYLKRFVDSLEPGGYTPLAETMAEAGLYFAGKASWFNSDDAHYPRGGVYPDSVVRAYSPVTDHPPMEYRCRKNYIILMTDGAPYHDEHQRLCGEYIDGQTIAGGKMPRLDQVAGFLYDNDINDYFDSVDFTQNIITYAIGFQGGDQNLLQDTADRGCGAGDTVNVNDGGLYFNAASPEDLSTAFTTIMADISRRQAMFAMPTVPLDHHSRAYAGSDVYMSMFQPTASGPWIGNLKKYRLNSRGDIVSCGGQEAIMDGSGQIRDSVSSCWSQTTDGGAVDSGGAGAVLLATAASERRIYANISEVIADLTHRDNAFSIDNPDLVPAVFGMSGDQELSDLVNTVRGLNKEWKLGDFNHSQPAVAVYETEADDFHSYVFAGANDGLLHCFDDADGHETWAFVPREQFSRLRYANADGHRYFMDGSPVVAETRQGQKILICGERRGGNHYYALDISDIQAPVFLYTHISGGQSWKRPQFTVIARPERKSGSFTTREVFLLTGGYDADMDHDAAADCGRSVYTIDAVSGARTGFEMSSADFSDMCCLVSAVALDLRDDGRTAASHVYAGDLAGHVYAARDYRGTDEGGQWLAGQWQKRKLFDVTGGGRKIFAEVDVVSEKLHVFDTRQSVWQPVAGESVFFGTGDRANPLRSDRINHFYCIKNDWQTGVLSKSSRVGGFATLDDDPGSDPDGDDADYVVLDVTDNRVQDGTPEEQVIALNALNARHNRGWYITLENTGEKCLSSPVVFDGVVYFTTYTPPDTAANEVSDPCRQASGDVGTSRLYALDYETGAAVYADYTADGRLDKADRCKILTDVPLSIPPSPKIFLTAQGPRLFVGTHQETPKFDLAGLEMLYWKQSEQ